MRQYKVVQFTDPMVPYEEFYPAAMHLRERFGLFHLTIREVRIRWMHHSKFATGASAGWLPPVAAEVSKVFGVKLEEV